MRVKKVAREISATGHGRCSLYSVRDKGMLLAMSVSFPRQKPRHLGLSLAFRTYYALRAVLPKKLLGAALLDSVWVLNRIAREHALFWVSGQLERERAFARDFVVRHVPEGSRVIDLGGGTGFGASMAAQRAAHVVLVDMNAASIAVARTQCPANVEAIVGDAFEVLAARGPFDAAVMLHFLEHVDDPAKVLEALRTRCRRLIVEVPDFEADPLNELRHRENRPCYTDADHVREFGLAELVDLLESAGWRVTETQRAGSMLYAVANA